MRAWSLAILSFGICAVLGSSHEAFAGDGAAAVRSLILDDFLGGLNPAGMPTRQADDGESGDPDCAIDIDPPILSLVSGPGLGDGGIQTATAVDNGSLTCVTAPVAALAEDGLTLRLLGPPGQGDPGVPGRSYEIFWGTSPALIVGGAALCQPFGCVRFGAVEFGAIDGTDPSSNNFRTAEAVLFVSPF